MNFNLFEKFEKEAERLLEKELLYPAYDYIIKCSHILNILDARQAFSPYERKNYINRVKKLACRTAKLWIKKENEV
jgi:glycyl-tRNA synthetase alpha chain